MYKKIDNLYNEKHAIKEFSEAQTRMNELALFVASSKFKSLPEDKQEDIESLLCLIENSLIPTLHSIAFKDYIDYKNNPMSDIEKQWHKSEKIPKYIAEFIMQYEKHYNIYACLLCHSEIRYSVNCENPVAVGRQGDIVIGCKCTIVYGHGMDNVFRKYIEKLEASPVVRQIIINRKINKEGRLKA